MARGRGRGRGKPSRGNFMSQNGNNKRKFSPKNNGKQFNNRSKENEHSYYVKEDKNDDFENAKRLKLDDSSSESENEAAYTKLITTFGNTKSLMAIQSSSDSESASDLDEGDEQSDIIAEEEEGTDDSDSVALDDENKEEVLSGKELETSKSAPEAETLLEVRDEVIEEQEIDEETTKEEEEADAHGKSTDPFVNHLHYELHEKLVNVLQTQIKFEQTSIIWPGLGKIFYQIPQVEEIQTDVENTKVGIIDKTIYANLGKIPKLSNFTTDKLSAASIKPQISDNIKAANLNNLNENSITNNVFTPFQSELFSIINNYQDLCFSERTFRNGEEIRFIYCLHAVNHILKTRTKILHHNARLSNKSEVPDEFRDQGFVRPKVLIVVPFRDSALRIVQMLIDILVPEEKSQVINKARFVEDFGGNELNLPKKNPKPDDYQQLFTGNTDDTFRIGLSITKKCLKLYTEFYASDIIIASPLGLRVIVGAPGEAERDYDFLASIEVLILDQAEQFLMQNWDHFLHVMDHLHMQPKNSHGTDFSRVRMWSINGLAKYYRQSLIFSSHMLPEISSFFNKKCMNYSGKAKVLNETKKGTICHVVPQVPHLFHRFTVNDVKTAIDARFEFFKDKILPQFKEGRMKHTLIYIPSYFDYVRVRNHFKEEELSFVQICEYSKENKIARARDLFYHAEAHFLLYSERFHHFRRIRLKGIRHLIFYQPPSVPNFYAELCNFMLESNQNKKSGNDFNMTVTVIYCKYDMMYLNSIVGTDRASKMVVSERNTHMFMTGD